MIALMIPVMMRRFAPLAVLLLSAAAGPAPAQAPVPLAAAKPPSLAFPLACEPGRTCAIQSYMDHDAGPGAKDYRCGPRSYDKHSGVDIRILDLKAMAGGVPVLAAAPGRVVAMRDSVEDLSIRDRVGGTNNQDCGNAVILDHGGQWFTQYCHMRLGSVRVKTGDMVKTGDPIGLVGLSGNTEFPHLHVDVRQGRAVVDPFAYGAPAGACSGGVSLWNAAAAAKLAYKDGEILNTGFTTAVVEMKGVESGVLPAPTRSGPALVAYARAIGLKAGDMQELTITGPDGKLVAEAPPSVLPRDQAQFIKSVGKRTPAEGWKSGTYRARYAVRRAGAVVLQRSFEIKL